MHVWSSSIGSHRLNTLLGLGCYHSQHWNASHEMHGAHEVVMHVYMHNNFISHGSRINELAWPWTVSEFHFRKSQRWDLRNWNRPTVNGIPTINHVPILFFQSQNQKLRNGLAANCSKSNCTMVWTIILTHFDTWIVRFLRMFPFVAPGKKREKKEKVEIFSISRISPEAWFRSESLQWTRWTVRSILFSSHLRRQVNGILSGGRFW